MTFYRLPYSTVFVEALVDILLISSFSTLRAYVSVDEMESPFIFHTLTRCAKAPTLLSSLLRTILMISYRFRAISARPSK